MQAVVSGLLTTFDETGKGKDIILLHGWGDNHQTFKGLSSDLANHYHMVALDLPGFGATQAPEKVWGLEDYAQYVAAFIEKQNLKPYAVIAHSNGGAIAIKGLSSEVIKAQKLVLLAAAGIRNRQKVRRLILKIVAKAGKVLTFWLSERHKRRLRKKLYGVAGSDMDVAPHLQETFKKTVRQDVLADAGHLKLPTLLIYGTEDTATPPLYGNIFKEHIAGSKLEIVDGASHFVHHDRSELVAQKIKDFLDA